MASRCAARLLPPPCASRCGWASWRVSVRPARYGASRGRAVVCAVSFRPCIDIHKGKVKQIVGSTLRDSSNDGTALVTNFESDKSPAEYANLYKEDKLVGGHVIMLGADPASQAAALEALRAYPGGLQLGGGINLENAISYLNEGASHVIITSMDYQCLPVMAPRLLHKLRENVVYAVSSCCAIVGERMMGILPSYVWALVRLFFMVTSGDLYYVFSEGKMNIERLRQLVDLVGKQRLVLDLSCRKKDGRYAIVTDRWQKFSDVFVDEPTIEYLAAYADEFLVHGVDLEGKRLGIDEELVALFGTSFTYPCNLRWGVSTMDDLERIKKAGQSRVDVTVGSALDIFGGDLPYEDVVLWHKEQNMVGQP